MSVHMIKDGRWICQWRDKTTGKHKKKYFGRGLEGEKKAKKYNKALGLNLWVRRTPKRESPRFIDLAESYLTAKAGDIEDSTRKNFIIKMESVIWPEIGELEALQITPHRMDLYVKKRLKTVKRTTVHREISDITAVLNWAVDRKYLLSNPIAGYKKPKRDDAVIPPPTDEEVSRILFAASTHLVRAICISYYTGLRPGQKELLSMPWDNVDLNRKTIYIISAHKGGPRARTVPLHNDFLKLLKRWRREDKIFAKEKKLKKTPDTIVHYRGRKIKSIKTAFKNAKKKANITRRLRPYDFRHAFASRALKDGADLKAVSEILGHSRPDTTARIYEHTDLDMHRDVVNRIGAINVKKK